MVEVEVASWRVVVTVGVVVAAWRWLASWRQWLLLASSVLQSANAIVFQASGVVLQTLIIARSMALA